MTKPIRYIFVDTETTSLKSWEGEIVEFSIGTEIGRSFKVMTRKVQPEKLHLADPRSLEINQYNEKDWKDAVSQKVAAGLMAMEIEKADVWIGHNPDFDIRFCRVLLKEHYPKVKFPKLVVDTRSLAVAALAKEGIKSSAMSVIRNFLGWSNEGAHTAEFDMKQCRRLFHMCMTMRN